MKTSKRKFEGCIQIDHRESPGITPEQARGSGPAVGKGQFYEAATSTCCHCQRIVILNPLREADRHYCRKCDDFICDLCANRHKLFPQEPHKSFAQVIEEFQNAGAKGETIVWRP